MENQTEFASSPHVKLHAWNFFKPRTITLLIVIIFLAIGIKFRWEALDCIRLVDWITRDYDRAFHLVDGNYIPLAGPETTGGGRLPGPFLYFLLSIPILFNYSYESIFFFNFILSCSSLISFFFIVKRFFGFYLASITTILFSINLLQIESIAYPINPSFIHIFAVAFFWLLMEFAVNKNYKVIPWIFLTITLAIQIHFSIASYYLVIILAAIILKIKIPLKYYLISLAIIFICLTPYFIYKKEFYQGVSEPSSRFFLDTQFSVLGVLKVITNYDTLNRIALNSFGDKLPFFYSPIIYNKINFWFLSIGFYGLLIFVFFKISNKKTKKIHREIALLLLFYIPGLIFGILSPTLKHYWYNYIFIPSATVLTAIVFETLFKVGKNYLQRSLVIIIFSIFIGYYIYFLKINFTSLQFASKQLRIGAFLNYYSYKNLIKGAFKKLDLSPGEFSENVYFTSYSSYSKKLIELIGKEIDFDRLLKKQKNDSHCFFIIDKKDWIKTEGYNYNNLQYFLLDQSLKIKPYKILSFTNKFRQKFIVFEYTPKLKQPCYQNSFNQFIVSPRVLKFLKLLKTKNYPIKGGTSHELEKKTILNSHSQLIEFNAKYLIQDPTIKIPIQISIKIIKQKGGYVLRASINYYEFTYFKSANRFNLISFVVKFFEKKTTWALKSFYTDFQSFPMALG